MDGRMDGGAKKAEENRVESEYVSSSTKSKQELGVH